MKTKALVKFIDFFPNTMFRYLDLTGAGRPPISSEIQRDDFNLQGYCAYLTPNGFSGVNAKKENCVSLNAFYIDVDKQLTDEEIEKIKAILMPTCIVKTFRGFHFYYCLDEPIYKSEVTPEEWESKMKEWEQIEQAIVDKIPDSDKQVKDIPRILRLINQYYWKGTGEQYKKGTEGAFKVKGHFKSPASVYSFSQMREVFPFVEKKVDLKETFNRYAEQEKKDFFDRVNKKYPIEDRPSFQALVSAKEGTIPADTGRNISLLVTASLMRQADWTQKKAITNIKTWHGLDNREIQTTIESAYRGKYSYSYKHPVIAHNMTYEEQQMISGAYTSVGKDRKDLDKTRFSNYEYEIYSRYPNFKKNDAGIVFDYKDGVYFVLSDQELSNIILNCLYDDMLWGYRTKRNVSDKTACLLAIIPDLIETPDNGVIFNCKNGLLNIKTRELKDHTPEFVSLIQSPASYDKNAKGEVWDQCISSWMEGDEKEDKTKVLQQFSGYCLSSSTKLSTALFLIGDGGNGKSTFADTLGMVIGSKATSNIDLDDLYSDFGLYGLVGKKLNIIEEVSGNYYESHKLKKIISGEELTINVKYKSQFKFRPQVKFVFAVNTMPRVDDTSTATERRLLTVQFLNNFRKNSNSELRFHDGILAKEISGILNWMLDGYDSLQKNGNRFFVTVEQKTILNEYREENSSIEGFIVECTETKEGEVISVRDLYDKYKVFCQKDGRKFKGSVGFTKEIKAYAKRTELFQFFNRMNGKESNRFEGLCINEAWAGVNTAFDKVGINSTLTDF